ncbi:CidA/LrgA family protein [Rhodobacteraceae bacterium CCMM004]|nr:CidA/LrgA family protein [Rhodobacteraceae bacterium CCMM004]
MILPLALLLSFQLAGEAAARALDLPLPGPVIGLGLLLAALLAVPRLEPILRTVTQPILANLSLLFVPAGVGVVGHLDLIRAEAAALAAVIVVSTAAAIAASALTFAWLARPEATE